LKRRWPLKHAIICVEKGLQKKIELLSELLQSQLNVEDYKIIELENHEGISEMLEMKKSAVPVIPKIELNRKTIGPKAKQNLGKLLEIFSETKHDEIREYEKQYISRYNHPKPQKISSSDLYKPEIPKPKRDMKKERK